MSCLAVVNSREVEVVTVDQCYIRDGYVIRFLMMMSERGKEYKTVKECVRKIAQEMGVSEDEVSKRLYPRLKNLIKTGMLRVTYEDMENSNVKRWKLTLSADVFISKKEKLAVIPFPRGVIIVDCRKCKRGCQLKEIFIREVS